MAVIRHHATAAVALLLGSSLNAADFEAWSATSDWYLSLGAATMPEIEEENSDGSTYEWQHLEGDFAPRLALGYLACAGNSTTGGWAAGIEVVFTTCDVTPERYRVGGTSFANPSNRTLRYHTAGVLVSGGYQFGIDAADDALKPFLILTPFIGLGAAFADSEVRDQNGAYATASDVGWYAEGGVRGGVLFGEGRWLGGVLVDLVYNTGEVSMSFPDGSSSDLLHERFGITVAVAVGYRL